jgi:hypothetical protein
MYGSEFKEKARFFPKRPGLESRKAGITQEEDTQPDLSG